MPGVRAPNAGHRAASSVPATPVRRCTPQVFSTWWSARPNPSPRRKPRKPRSSPGHFANCPPRATCAGQPWILADQPYAGWLPSRRTDGVLFSTRRGDRVAYDHQTRLLQNVQRFSPSPRWHKGTVPPAGNNSRIPWPGRRGLQPAPRLPRPRIARCCWWRQREVALCWCSGRPFPDRARSRDRLGHAGPAGEWQVVLRRTAWSARPRFAGARLGVVVERRLFAVFGHSIALLMSLPVRGSPSGKRALMSRKMDSLYWLWAAIFAPGRVGGERNPASMSKAKRPRNLCPRSRRLRSKVVRKRVVIDSLRPEEAEWIDPTVELDRSSRRRLPRVSCWSGPTTSRRRWNDKDGRALANERRGDCGGVCEVVADADENAACDRKYGTDLAGKSIEHQGRTAVAWGIAPRFAPRSPRAWRERRHFAVFVPNFPSTAPKDDGAVKTLGEIRRSVRKKSAISGKRRRRIPSDR